MEKIEKKFPVVIFMESEVPFIILSDNYEEIIGKIKQVIEWNKYKAIWGGTIDIEDRYYDTDDKILKRNQINLRIRSINNKIPVVTLKTPGENNKDYFNRSEIEENWSNSIFETILNELKSIETDFDISKNYYHDDPETTFMDLGLNEIMKKTSKRTLINAVVKETELREFEFALDFVSIDLKNQNSINFYELEIESKRQGNQTILKEFTTKILESPIFERWSFNKLETGLATIYLINNDRLEKSLDIDSKNFLTGAGLEKIKLYLENNKN
ncbi:MAG: CYTH domain-containing protein [Candidatus Nitrosocosmicus sp.]|jgi:inorganic triphosphatase YgiF|nr:CYTH domain-containing protein [Candidatus Nitrosocosmicus sp.]